MQIAEPKADWRPGTRYSQDLQFELIIAGGDRIAPIAAPSDTEVENRKIPTKSLAAGYARRGALWASPRSPGRRNAPQDSLGKPKVSLDSGLASFGFLCAYLCDLCVSALNRISQTPANPRARSVSRLPKQPACPP